MRSVTNARLNPICSPVSQEYEEVIIPPARVIPPRKSERLILVNELDELARGSFPVCSPPLSPTFFKNLFFQGYPSLNRIQSIVYPTAYESNENILVCGASSGCARGH